MEPTDDLSQPIQTRPKRSHLSTYSPHASFHSKGCSDDGMFRYEDIGSSLVTLVVFETDVNAAGFASYCLSRRSMAWTDDGRRLSLYVSSLERMAAKGFWSDVWLAVGGRMGGTFWSEKVFTGIKRG